MTEEICKSYTRFTREQFILISQNLNKMRDTDKRSKYQALAVYLF